MADAQKTPKVEVRPIKLDDRYAGHVQPEAVFIEGEHDPIVIRVSEFKDKLSLSIRRFYKSGDTWKPGNRGFEIPLVANREVLQAAMTVLNRYRSGSPE